MNIYNNLCWCKTCTFTNDYLQKILKQTSSVHYSYKPTWLPSDISYRDQYQTRSRIFQLASYVVRRRGRAYCHVIRYCYYYNILKALLHNEDGRAWIIPGDVVLNNGSVMVLAGESCCVVHYRVRSTTPSARPFVSQTSWWS